MTSYTQETIECPHCRAAMTVLLLRTCNAFGATSYTDGYIKGEMYDETCWLNTCPGCGKYFWLDDAKSRTDDGDRAVAADEVLPPAEGVRDEGYETALRARPWKNRAQELYLRIRAWWWSNMPYREQSGTEFAVSEQNKENLTRLLELLDTDDSHQTLMRAEIYRQLGRFEQAIATLDDDFDDRYGPAGRRIRELAERRDRAVQPIGV